MLWSDVKVGARVRCLYNVNGWLGRVGTIVDVVVDGGDTTYHVHDDNGEVIGNEGGWSSRLSFELLAPIQEPLVTTSLTQEYVRVGTRVVGRHGEWNNCVGRIFKVDEHNTYWVEDDNGKPIGYGGWGYLDSFDRVLEAAEPIAAEPSTAPIQTEIKPCPRAYYGLPECTCGGCAATPKIKYALFQT